jgi:hypothetical protein
VSRAILASVLVACQLGACSGTTDVYLGSDDPVVKPGADSAPAPTERVEPEPTPETPAAPSIEPGGAIPPDRDSAPPLPDGGAEHDSSTTDGAVDAGSASAPGCPAGTADCDGDAANRCETDTTRDMANCGECGQRCHANGHDARAATCVDGRCNLTCVDPLFGDQDCDGDPDNGCEAPLLSDDQNCGDCGVVCTCFNGQCL